MECIKMLFKADATYYAEQIKSGHITCQALVEMAINNINMFNEQLNAVVHTQTDEALALAKEYDEQRATRSSLPPFYGVPILIKDLGQAQAGQPSGCGAKLLKGIKHTHSSHFVARLLQAGFIVVGRSNVPEFGFKNISDSAVFGAVNSPLDLTRNPGGSSGGAAAALKAGIVPIVTASDGGGSIRIPASFSGLIGLKTSRGRMPVGPDSYRGWQGASIDFFLTKSVRDTFSLLTFMQTVQPEAPFSIPRIEKTCLEPLQKPLKIAYTLDSPVGTAVTKSAQQAVNKTIKNLKALGHTVVNDQPDVNGIEAMKTYFIVNAVETAVMMQDLGQMLGRSVTIDDVELMSWALYRTGLKISGIEYSRVLSYWDNLSAVTDTFFDNYDMLLTPAVNDVAPRHGHFKLSEAMQAELRNIDSVSAIEQQQLVWQMFAESLAYTPFTQQQNLTGQPAIALPVYHQPTTGLPIAVQFSARKGHEYQLLQLAKQFEDIAAINSSICEIDNN